MNAASARAVNTLRPQILERRARLQAAAGSVSAEYLNDLLTEIDNALQRIDDGTCGICEHCHDTIEAEVLQVNPMARFCIDHLSGQELRAHERDLELATRIQSKLLPPCNLSLDHWTTYYRYEPVGPVGGDYCEITVLEDARSLFFAVGDVAGKGVAASLLMTHLSAIFRSLTSLQLPLSEVMSRANRLFCESTVSEHYATLVCGRACGDSVEISNAGHCPPLLLRQDRTERLAAAGVPLGLFCGSEYPLTQVRLTDGDSLVLYSDGLSEAEDPDGNQFGENGMTSSIRRQSASGPEALAQLVMQDVARFRRGVRPADDSTLLILCRQE